LTRILEIRGDETNVVRKSAERLHILATLKKTGWVLSGRRGAAARLGINRSTLQFRMKKLGIERPSISNPGQRVIVRREPAASIRFDLTHKFV
jgi:DNA-binding NtrC family response regulator